MDGSTATALAAPGAQGTTTILAGGAYGDGLDARRASVMTPYSVLATDQGVLLSDHDHHQVRIVRPDGTIQRIAGRSEGFGGDGGPALSASLNRPRGLALDRDGNLLIADAGNHRVRRVNLTTGLISTVAGNGERTFSGDGGDARQASLAYPVDVATDRLGRLYIADGENRRIRRVDGNGRIDTYAGVGRIRAGSSSVDLTANDLDGVPASSATIFPISLATDAAGDLYFGDVIGCRVRKIDRHTGIVMTVAGGEPSCGYGGDGGPATRAALSLPEGIEIDRDGRLWIADPGNNRLRVVDAAGTITTAVGDGTEGCPNGPAPATGPGGTNPYDVSIDADGGIVYASGYCNRVFRAASGSIRPFAGNGTRYAGGSGDPAASINFSQIEAVAWGPDSRPYFADDRGIWTVDGAGRAILIAGGVPGDADGPALEARFQHVMGLAFDRDGALWIADAFAGKVKRLAGGVVETMAGNPKSQIQGEDGPALEVRLGAPADVAPMPDGRVYFTESFYGVGAGILRVLQDGLAVVVGGTDENQYLDEIGDGGPVGAALFREPWGLEALGDGSLLIADRQHQRVRRLAPDGTIATLAGDGGEETRGDGTIATLASFSTPEDVAADGSGNLFITDGKNVETFQAGRYLVRRIAPNGMVSRAAGTGVSDEGAPGPALQSPLRNPTAVDAGPAGILIGDATTVRLLVPPSGGWPTTPRTVRCDSYFRDREGDARAQLGVSFVRGPNEPWLDIVDGDVTTDGSSLTVTFDVLDLSERALLPPTAELGNAWAWYYRFLVAGKTRYVAAFSPHSAPGSTSVPQVVFEHGDTSFGRGGATYGVVRKGAATGSLDFVNDRVTITAPLASMGLQPGQRVTYHELIGGRLVDTSPIGRFIDDDDTTFIDGFLPGTLRSFEIGKRCPEDH